MRRTPLPPGLAGTAFLVSEGVAAGAARDRLNATDLAAPFHGVRAPALPQPATVLDRCRAYHPRLAPLQFFSHTTAAALWEIPLPLTAALGNLHVSAIPPGREPRTKGVSGHRLDIPIDSLTLAQGMPVPQRTETWAQLGTSLGLDDLIVAADALLNDGVEPGELAETARRLRRRGAVDLTTALDEARVGSESPRETRTRLVLVRGGLPEPELNWMLRAQDGRFVARLDLAYPKYRVCVEYDGRQHAETEQFVRDADRWADIEAQGWILVRVLGHHFDDPTTSILGRTRRALLTRGWR